MTRKPLTLEFFLVTFMAGMGKVEWRVEKADLDALTYVLRSNDIHDYTITVLEAS